MKDKVDVTPGRGLFHRNKIQAVRGTAEGAQHPIVKLLFSVHDAAHDRLAMQETVLIGVDEPDTSTWKFLGTPDGSQPSLELHATAHSIRESLETRLRTITSVIRFVM
jgi:hypothetical protein